MHRKNETEICSESMELEQKRKKSKWKAINLYGNRAHRVADCMCEWPRVTYIETQRVYCKASYVLLFILACRLCVRSANPARSFVVFVHSVYLIMKFCRLTIYHTREHTFWPFFIRFAHFSHSFVCFQKKGFELCNFWKNASKLKMIILPFEWLESLDCFKKGEMRKDIFIWVFIFEKVEMLVIAIFCCKNLNFPHQYYLVWLYAFIISCDVFFLHCFQLISLLHEIYATTCSPVTLLWLH